ncbi:uncharacterized protein [Nicotiana sylvestris]|uniref:uncharacterized protein n=1 Tax=Nicotiana sylvestris TaxID=4096 RepID=UPI00388C8DDE
MHDFIMAEDSKLWDVICDGPYILTKALKVVVKNFHAKKSLVCVIRPDEYNRISACDTAKEIWEALQIAHEGTTQVKKSKIDMLTTEYELFRMKDDEPIQDMHTRFTSIINDLHSLGEIIPRNKLVRKILSILPSTWESKVNAITNAKDLQELTVDELVGNLKTYKIKRMIDSKRREPKKEKNLYSKYNTEKATKRNPVPDKDFKRKRSADNVVKHTLAAWGDSSSESEDETDACDNSMMAVKSEENEYDSIFSLMAQSDYDEDDNNSEVNFRDVQKNMKSCSSKKLISLASVLVDSYHSLVEDKYLTLELGEAEQTRDDLVVCVVDLKETICEMEKEKFVLTKNIANIEHERDDLVFVAVDHKETIENFRKEREALMKRAIEIEEERDDLLAVITSLCVESEKKKHLQTELERIKNDLEKSLKSTWSSEAITAMYVNNGGNGQGIGLQREKTTYNPHSKYVIVPDNWLCTHYGNNGHFKENCQARVQSIQKTKYLLKIERKQSRMFMDSRCSKYMTGNTMDFLSLEALQRGSVSFGNGKKGSITKMQVIFHTSFIQDLLISVQNVWLGKIVGHRSVIKPSENS